MAMNDFILNQTSVFCLKGSDLIDLTLELTEINWQLTTKNIDITHTYVMDFLVTESGQWVCTVFYEVGAHTPKFPLLSKDLLRNLLLLKDHIGQEKTINYLIEIIEEAKDANPSSN